MMRIKLYEYVWQHGTVESLRPDSIRFRSVCEVFANMPADLVLAIPREKEP